jgi:hypothetical protein
MQTVSLGVLAKRVCMCVCAFATQRKRDRETDRDRGVREVKALSMIRASTAASSNFTLQNNQNYTFGYFNNSSF